MECTRSAIANGQADYQSIDAATRALELDPSSSERQRDALDQLKASLIMHVYHDKAVKTTYTAAIRSWLTTQLACILLCVSCVHPTNGRRTRS